MAVATPPRPQHQNELDALIEEARRRARRRRARNALALAALAGAGLYTAFGSGGGGGSSIGNGGASPGGAAGRPGSSAHAQPFADAPQSQRFTTFGRCPLASPSRYLPSHVGCLTVRRTDVDGDGRRDLVLLYAHLDARGYARFSPHGTASGFELKLVRADGSSTRVRVPRGDLNATILRAANINGQPGAELLVHEYHVTTSEGLGAYTFDRVRLRRARGFVFNGSDAGLVFGLTCDAGPPSTIVQHDFTERIPFRGVWDRTDTTYRWIGARLRRASTQKVLAPPTRDQTGVHC